MHVCITCCNQDDVVRTTASLCYKESLAGAPRQRQLIQKYLRSYGARQRLILATRASPLDSIFRIDSIMSSTVSYNVLATPLLSIFHCPSAGLSSGVYGRMYCITTSPSSLSGVSCTLIALWYEALSAKGSTLPNSLCSPSKKSQKLCLFAFS